MKKSRFKRPAFFVSVFFIPVRYRPSAAGIARRAAAGAIGAGRFVPGTDGEPALLGAVVEIVDIDAAERLQLVGQVGMYVNIDTV